MNEENSIKTIEFVQLIKSVIEYFGTTKTEIDKPNESVDSIDEVSKMLQSMSSMNLDSMGIKIPNEIDTEIRDTFIAQIRYYKKKAEDNTKL